LAELLGPVDAVDTKTAAWEEERFAMAIPAYLLLVRPLTLDYTVLVSALREHFTGYMAAAATGLSTADLYSNRFPLILL